MSRRFRKRYVPLHPADPAATDLFDVPPDNGSRIFRLAQLPERVEIGSSLRSFLAGFAGRKVGCVLEQRDDGTALVSLDLDAPSDAEVFVEVTEAPAEEPDAPRPGRNIFDFTDE